MGKKLEQITNTTTNCSKLKAFTTLETIIIIIISIFAYLFYSANKTRSDLNNRLSSLDEEIKSVFSSRYDCIKDKQSKSFNTLLDKSRSLQTDITDFDKKFLSGDTSYLKNNIGRILSQFDKINCDKFCKQYSLEYNTSLDGGTCLGIQGFEDNKNLLYITLGLIQGKLYDTKQITPIE